MASTLFRKMQTATAKDGTKRQYKSSNWYGRFRVPTTDKRSKSVVRCLRTADKEVAKKRLRKLEREFARNEDNLYYEQQQRPLADHLADYEQWLRAKRSAASHVEKQPRRIRAMFTACGFAYWPDIRMDRFEQELSHLGVKTATRNAYLTAVKAFCNWMVRIGRAELNPLQHVSRVRVTDADDSRPLNDDELRCLLNTTLTQPTLKGMTGRERWVAYRLAAETGFRANELRTLTWGYVDLDSDPPTATALAAYSKSRERAEQPLSTTTAAMLTDWRLESGNPCDALVLPCFPQDASGPSRIFHADIKAAGLQYKTSAGKLIFHSLRHTYITNLDRSAGKRGLSQRVVQRLARHKTAAMTDRYTHPRLHDKVAAVEGLPDVVSERAESRATGTTDAKPTPDS